MDAILDYRAALRARDLMNHPDKRAGFEQLAAQPYLMQVLAWMRRAQDGRPLDPVEGKADPREGLRVAHLQRSVPSEDAEDAEDAEFDVPRVGTQR